MNTNEDTMGELMKTYEQELAHCVAKANEFATRATRLEGAIQALRELQERIDGSRDNPKE